MLESEIKKLTEAVTALTAALSSQSQGAAPTAGITAAATPAQSTTPPAQYTPPVQPAFTPPPTQPTQPAQQAQVPYTAPTQPGAMDHTQAQQKLGAVVQRLGNAAPVQQLLARYAPSGQLSAVPAEHLAHLVSAAEAL